MKILIFGASGSGTTTLGIEIEKQTQFKHLDADYYYWKKTNPPFQEKVELQERNKHLKADFNRFENVVISGSLVSWGKESSMQSRKERARRRPFSLVFQ